MHLLGAVRGAIRTNTTCSTDPDGAPHAPRHDALAAATPRAGASEGPAGLAAAPVPWRALERLASGRRDSWPCCACPACGCSCGMQEDAEGLVRALTHRLADAMLRLGGAYEAAGSLECALRVYKGARALTKDGAHDDSTTPAPQHASALTAGLQPLHAARALMGLARCKWRLQGKPLSQAACRAVHAAVQAMLGHAQALSATVSPPQHLQGVDAAVHGAQTVQARAVLHAAQRRASGVWTGLGRLAEEMSRSWWMADLPTAAMLTAVVSLACRRAAACSVLAGWPAAAAAAGHEGTLGAEGVGAHTQGHSVDGLLAADVVVAALLTPHDPETLEAHVHEAATRPPPAPASRAAGVGGNAARAAAGLELSSAHRSLAKALAIHGHAAAAVAHARCAAGWREAALTAAGGVGSGAAVVVVDVEAARLRAELGMALKVRAGLEWGLALRRAAGTGVTRSARFVCRLLCAAAWRSASRGRRIAGVGRCGHRQGARRVGRGGAHADRRGFALLG